MAEREVEVLVVGGGPTGLITAVWLRRLGIHVACIDKLAEPSLRPKGNCIQTRTIELMSMMNLADPLISGGQIATHSASYFDGQEIFSRTFLDLLTDSNFGAVLWTSQADIEQVMTEAFELAGGRIERGSEVVDLTHDGTTAVVGVEADGRRDEIRARWVVAADGSHSTVRRLLGIERTGRDFPQRWAMATVRLEPEMPADQESTFYAHGHPVLYIDPGPSGWVRLVTMSVDQQFDPAAATREMFDELLKAVRAPYRISECDFVGTYFVHEHLATTFRTGNIFLAGDAAHEVTPLAGQGMNTGIQDGINLAWKLAMVVRGTASPDLLSTYEPERMLAARQADRLSESMTDWAITVNDHTLHATDPTDVVRELQTDLSAMDYSQEAQVLLRYPPSVIVQDWLTPEPVPGELYAGDRVPTMYKVTRADGSDSVLTDLISEREFTVIVVNPTPTAEQTAHIDTVVAELVGSTAVFIHLVSDTTRPTESTPNHVLQCPDDVLAALSGGQAAVLVIRPDGYVGARIPLARAETLLPQYFGGIRGVG